MKQQFLVCYSCTFLPKWQLSSIQLVVLLTVIRTLTLTSTLNDFNFHAGNSRNLTSILFTECLLYAGPYFMCYRSRSQIRYFEGLFFEEFWSSMGWSSVISSLKKTKQSKGKDGNGGAFNTEGQRGDIWAWPVSDEDGARLDN